MAELEERLTGAALKLLETCSWSELTLMQVARRAKIDAATLQGIAPNKPALFGLVLGSIGHATAKHYQHDSASEDARDRLLDVALTWFEALNAHKPAVRSLYEGLKRDPLCLIAARAPIIGAAEWLLALAEADTGPALPARALALAGMMARAVPVWLEDDAEMTQTMARLDGDVRRGENIFSRARGRDTDQAKPPQRSRAAAAEKPIRKAGSRHRSRARNRVRRGR
jgi:hypothetical protein